MSSEECTWCHDGQGDSYSNGTNSTMKIIFVASSIACVTGFISLTCCCMIFFLRRVTNPRRIVVAEPTVTPSIAATINTSTTSCSPARGIDPQVLSSSTVFAYSSTSGDQEKLDCAVCLSEMKDGEKARRLSWCGHRFHAECVDEWLRSHSTCPLCRSSTKTEFPQLHV